MSRESLLWVFIKALGIYFLVKGLLGFVETFMIIVTGDMGVAPGWVLEHPGRGTMLVYSLFSTGIGGYMLFDGSLLLRLASRKPIPSEPDAAGSKDDSSHTA